MNYVVAGLLTAFAVWLGSLANIFSWLLPFVLLLAVVFAIATKDASGDPHNQEFINALCCRVPAPFALFLIQGGVYGWFLALALFRVSWSAWNDHSN